MTEGGKPQDLAARLHGCLALASYSVLLALSAFGFLLAKSLMFYPWKDFLGLTKPRANDFKRNPPTKKAYI